MLWRHWRQNVLKESETNILICLLFPTLALNYCFLRKGDVALLNCTAIVNTSNESLTDKNPVSESIFMLAGPDLKEDLQKLRGKWTFLGLLVLRKHIFWCLKNSFLHAGIIYYSTWFTAIPSDLRAVYGM